MYDMYICVPTQMDEEPLTQASVIPPPPPTGWWSLGTTQGLSGQCPVYHNPLPDGASNWAAGVASYCLHHQPLVWAHLTITAGWLVAQTVLNFVLSIPGNLQVLLYSRVNWWDSVDVIHNTHDKVCERWYTLFTPTFGVEAQLARL